MNYAYVRPVRALKTTESRVRDAVLALHRQQQAAALVVPGASEKTVQQARQMLRAIGPSLEALAGEVAGVVYLASQRQQRVTEITPIDAIEAGPFVFNGEVGA